MLNFTRFRNANEEEISALKTRGLKSTLGNPLSFDTKSLYEDILITVDHAFAFFPASFLLMIWSRKKQNANISVRNSTSQVLMISYRKSICFLPETLSFVYLLRCMDFKRAAA